MYGQDFTGNIVSLFLLCPINFPNNCQSYPHILPVTFIGHRVLVRKMTLLQ